MWEGVLGVEEAAAAVEVDADGVTGWRGETGDTGLVVVGWGVTSDSEDSVPDSAMPVDVVAIEVAETMDSLAGSGSAMESDARSGVFVFVVVIVGVSVVGFVETAEGVADADATAMDGGRPSSQLRPRASM